jgi:hypothetical protein
VYPTCVEYTQEILNSVLVECKGSLAKRGKYGGAGGLQGKIKEAIDEQLNPSLGISISIAGVTTPILVCKGLAVGIHMTDSANWLCEETVLPSGPCTQIASARLDISSIHYAKWLVLMGLSPEAEVLYGRDTDLTSVPATHRFRVYRLGEIEFLALFEPNPLDSLFFNLWLNEFPGFPARLNGQDRWIMFGLERKILELILQEARSGESQPGRLTQALLDLGRRRDENIFTAIKQGQSETDDESLAFSVFGDGAAAFSVPFDVIFLSEPEIVEI